MNSYILSLILFTIIISIADFYTNKYYIRKWNKLILTEKFQLILLLLLHNVIYFIIYFTIFFIPYTKPIYIVTYLIFILMVIIHWKTNNNRCKITELQNKLLNTNLSHGYRDFISMNDINKVIHILLKKNFSGIINIGSGKKIYLKNIAKIILKKYNKKAVFLDNSQKTYLISNNEKLKRLTKLKIDTNIRKMIF